MITTVGLSSESTNVSSPGLDHSVRLVRMLRRCAGTDVEAPGLPGMS
jgi:hypothetical protein